MDLTYILISIIGGFFYSELIGFWIHILIHSNKIKYLSRSHMIHHLKLYGPKMKMTSKQYKISVKNRLKVSGLGMEWIITLGVVMAATYIIGSILGAPLLYLLIFMGTAILWGIFLFAYMHNSFHLEDFWMMHNKILKKWFYKIRDLHYTHHKRLSDDGRMNTNYGICFFFFDRIFRTYKKEIGIFNEKGFQKAETRYDYILKKSL